MVNGCTIVRGLESRVQIDEKLWAHCQAICAGPKPVPRGTPIPKTHMGRIGRVKVFLVDGNAVKLRYHMDFVEGNNSAEPDWIPKDELWISNELVQEYWALGAVPLLGMVANQDRLAKGNVFGCLVGGLETLGSVFAPLVGPFLALLKFPL